jgi:hypothetical protein
MKTFIVRTISIVFLMYSAISCKSPSKLEQDKAASFMPWQVKPIIVDGNNEDWNLPYTYSDNKVKIEYSFSNDSENLYISLKTSDRMTGLKILDAGMQVWIDCTGKKDKTTGIVNPLENAEPVIPGKGSMGQNGSSNNGNAQALQKLISSAGDFSLMGFNGCDGSYSVSQKNSCDIQVKIGMNKNGELVWEAAVPFKSFPNAAISKARTGQAIGIDFEINALQKFDKSSMAQGGGQGGGVGGGHGGMGGGRRGGGGPGGGMGGSGSDDRSRLFEITETWTKISMHQVK